MVDSTVILNWVQSVGVLAALGFAGYELYQRNREQRFRNYLDHMTAFFDVTKMLVENRDLHPLYQYSTVDLEARAYDDLSAEQTTRVHYCDVVIGLCETVWVANREGWLSDTEWPYIQAWIRQLGQSPDFRWTVEWVGEDYSIEFMNEVRELLDAASGRLQSSALPNMPLQPSGADGPVDPKVRVRRSQLSGRRWADEP